MSDKIYLSKEAHGLLKRASEKKGAPMSKLASDLIKDFGIADSGVKVILTIPTELTKKNKTGLEEWLKLRCNALVNTYYK